VHLGHLVLAQDALELAPLDRVVFVPGHHPPHKRGRDLAPGPHRVALLERAIEGQAAFEVSDVELRRGGTSYTVDTVEQLRSAHPSADLFFLIGADSLFELHTWRRITDLLQMCTILVCNRPGFPLDRLEDAALRLPDPWPQRLREQFLPSNWIGISSSDIRSRLAAGRSVRYLTPAGVCDYIQTHSLYLPSGGSPSTPCRSC